MTKKNYHRRCSHEKILLTLILILFLGCATTSNIVPDYNECPKIITHVTENYIYEGDFDPIKIFNTSIFVGEKDDFVGHKYIYKENTDEKLPILRIAFYGKPIKEKFNIKGYSYYKNNIYYAFVFIDIPNSKSGYVQVLPRLK